MMIALKKLLVFVPPLIAAFVATGGWEAVWALGSHSYAAPLVGVASAYASLIALVSAASRAVDLDAFGWKHFIPELQRDCAKVSCWQARQRLAACEKALDRADKALLELDVR